MKKSTEFVYKVTLPKFKEQWLVDKWCKEQFGPRWEAVGNRAGTWCCFWRGRSIPGSYEWLFSDEKQFAWFMLRWSNGQTS